MKKKNCLLLFALFVVLSFLTSVKALSFDFEKKAIHNVVTLENITIPASYEFTITNKNDFDDTFRIYTLLAVTITPSQVEIDANSKKTFTLYVLPSEKVKEKCRGVCAIKYYIRNSEDVITDILRLEVLPLSSIISVELPESVKRDDKTVSIVIKNEKNIDLGNVFVSIDSKLFKGSKQISLKPRSSVTVILETSDEIGNLESGTYNVSFDFLIGNYTYSVTKNIELERYTKIVTTETKHFGFLGFTTTITKTNVGNAPEKVRIEVKKTRFQNAFTGYSIATSNIKVNGNVVVLVWEKTLKPGESFTVDVKTNYSLPVIVLATLIAGATGIYIGKKPKMIVKKKVKKIKTKSDEFALKTIIFIKNKGMEARNVKCIDYIPKFMNIYERFAVEPSVKEKNKLQWNFEKLEPNQTLLLSYIMYSKVKPVGSVELPKANVSFVDEKDKQRVVSSNKVLVLTS